MKEEMINKKMLIDFVDENGNNCNTKKSYAQINNNKIKISLTCDIEQKTTEITI